ncbi:gamma-aminobutyric acid receptor subunit beta-1-like [Branchiostoma lanceolatum]|uniref:gamma-aminobutyric acid receptor subunit beta-1-like n=1 Tax=Branchiostoma lanceolatum TaxID=7740 RepID=UPI0034566E08
MATLLLDSGCTVGALFLFLVTVFTLPHRTWQNAPGDADIPDVEEMLEVRGYDRNFRPGFGGPPLLVDMSLSVASIDRVSEVDMDYTLTIFLREYWRDERLHFSETNRSLSLDGRLVERLWVPDTFLVNAKSSFLHKVTVDNRLLRLFPDGRLLYGLRITAKAACPMDLRKYPLDVQTCPLQFESYGYTTEDIRFKWKDGNESIHGLERIELAQFWVGDHEVSDEVQKYETGEYPRLTIRFKLYRNIMYFILQTYLPATLLVVLSWVSFWINHEAVPARVALGITTVLTMTTFITSARDSLPKISYIKAIDVYCVMCFLFVFAALLEYAAVNYHSSVRQRREQKALKAKKSGAEDVHKQEEQPGRLGGLLAALKRKGFDNGPEKSDEQPGHGLSVTVTSKNLGKDKHDSERQGFTSPGRGLGKKIPWSRATRTQENVPLNVFNAGSTNVQRQSDAHTGDDYSVINDDHVCLNIPTLNVSNQSLERRRRSDASSRLGRNSDGSSRPTRKSSIASTASPRGSIARMIIDYAREMEEKGMELVPQQQASTENVSNVDDDDLMSRPNDDPPPVIRQPESHLRVMPERRRALSSSEPPTSALKQTESRLSLSADPRARKLSGMGMAVLNAAKLQKEANDRAAAAGSGRGRPREQSDATVRKRPVSFASLGQKVMKIQEEGRQERKRLTIAEVVSRVKTSNIKLQVKDVNTIDKYSRVVFPGVFFLFCVMYWVSYAHT